MPVRVFLRLTMITEHDIQTQLLEACIEALSLFDDYPQCYEAIGTYEVLNAAIANALKESQK